MRLRVQALSDGIAASCVDSFSTCFVSHANLAKFNEFATDGFAIACISATKEFYLPKVLARFEGSALVIGNDVAVSPLIVRRLGIPPKHPSLVFEMYVYVEILSPQQQESSITQIQKVILRNMPQLELDTLELGLRN